MSGNIPITGPFPNITRHVESPLFHQATLKVARAFAFIPLAIPIMFGPGGIATLIGMAATMHLSAGGLQTYVASVPAIVARLTVTCLSLTYAGQILTKIGPKGIDVASRITGFFVAAMGMGLLLSGVVEFLQSYGIMTGK